MLKEILNLKGVQVLNKKVMRKVNGNGGTNCGCDGGGGNPNSGDPTCQKC